jgi:hypothetical protein
MRVVLLGAFATLCIPAFAEEARRGPAASDAVPASSPAVKKELTKLPGVIGNDVTESTPLLYQGRPILFHSRRPIKPGPIDQIYLFLKDVESGKELARFGQNHSFGSAFVNGDEIHVFASEVTNEDWVRNIYHFSSKDKDLKTWNRELAIAGVGGEHLPNSSVCRDDQGYLMAYESDIPLGFCVKFARSKDLSKWQKIDGLTFAGVGGEQYSACSVIRYFKPYYYMIYLHAAIPGHNGWVSFLARSKDLETWQLSPKNPILEAGEGEGSNNSDVDLIEIDGKTYVYYTTGDQATWGELKQAVYPGSMQEFFEGYFPADAAMTEVSARLNRR